MSDDFVDAGNLYNAYAMSPSSAGVGDYFSDLFLGTDSVQTKNQNYMNWNLLKEQNRYNEYMSNTAYQRAVRDMEKAGINPMLAAINGGAYSPQSAGTSFKSSQGATKILHDDVKNAIKSIIKAVGVASIFAKMF